ncbi:MAG: superoxide dismutase [Minisyncoccota bacterium]
MTDSYIAKDFKHLLGLTGFSDTLLTNHFTLYEGYVKNTNSLISLLATKEVGTPEYAELKRRFGWEWNGVRLHELYFSNMTRETNAFDASILKEKITAIYGSLENWKKDFIATGSMRGIGWVILLHDRENDILFNVWVNEHDMGHLTGCTPLLVMDVFEHAYMSDYGIKKAEYIGAFFQSLDWSVMEKRFVS